MNFVRAINELHTNIWAMLIIAGGISLACCGKSDIGRDLVVGGFALFKSSSVGIVQGVSNGTKV